MILTKEELIGSMQHEVSILLHLAGKIDRNQLEYRPTPKQRSTIELLRFLSYMGPMFIQAVKAGAFDGNAWQAAVTEADALNFDQVLAAIQKQTGTYAQQLSAFTDADFRGEIDLFGSGQKSSRGSVIIRMVLGGCAAYRMQLFIYLKACGREELNTMNLWAGVDAPMPTV